MSDLVEATATAAGHLFSAHRFDVPDFQREYAWRVDDEVADYWRDVSASVDEGVTHFLGLVIITEEEGAMTIVDGQQRLLTTFLLAKVLYDAAIAHGRRLVANSIVNTFLYELDFQTEHRVARFHLSTPKDSEALEQILAEQPAPVRSSRLTQAWTFLRDKLADDLRQHDAPLRLGQWAQHLNTGLQFAVFQHPDRNAAFKVYEVINTRGKQLTPAELLKSYIIGTAGTQTRSAIVEEWRRAEESLSAAEITRFVRHATTLRHGYIIQRDLYQLLTRRYKTATAVEELMAYLMSLLPYYQQFNDPTADYVPDEDFARSARVLDYLGLATVRPLFLAIAQLPDPLEGFLAALRVIVPRITVESFGTGSIEARFSNAARDIAVSRDWRGPVAELMDLKPSVDAFIEVIKGGRPLSRSHMHVLRASALQESALPSLEGGLHLIRTRYGSGWDFFDDEDFRDYGNRIGNTAILNSERRPHGSSSAAGALDRLVPSLADEEILSDTSIATWSPVDVEAIENRVALAARAVWYPEVPNHA